MSVIRYGIEVISQLWNNRKTFFYLLKNDWKKAITFAYVKSLVPCGEGSLGFIFHMFRPLVRKYPNIIRFPRQVEIEITNVCNKKCLFCEHTYWKEPNKHLSFEDFKHIINQFPRLKWVNITGEGDSFLNPDYLDMIEYLSNKNVNINLVDSFDLVDEDISRKLIECKVNSVWVSFDAVSKQTYEKIKKGCNFEKVIHNIQTLIDLKRQYKSPLPEICFRYIISTLNLEQIPLMPFFVHENFGNRKDLGDNASIEFAGLLSFPEIEKYFVPHVPYRIIYDTMKNAKYLNLKVSFSHPGLDLVPVRNCVAWAEPYIMLGGYVLPCCAVLMANNRPYLRKYSFGNINETSFKDIWNSDRYKKFRNMVMKDDSKIPLLCKGCRAKDTIYREIKYGVDYNV